MEDKFRHLDVILVIATQELRDNPPVHLQFVEEVKMPGLLVVKLDF